MTKQLTAAEAISESRATNSVVTIEGSDQIHLDLLAECEDHVTSYHDKEEGFVLTEYWGGHEEDGDTWRVHVRENE